MAHGLPKVFVSEPISIDLQQLENEYYRADLEFYGIDHGGASYEGRVFINNPEASQNTEKVMEKGYAGSFHVFGHGGCFGDVGHCDLRTGERNYDLRPSHPLTKGFARVIVTEVLRKEVKRGRKEFVVTVVPVIKGGDPNMCDLVNVVKFERLSLVTFDK